MPDILWLAPGISVPKPDDGAQLRYNSEEAERVLSFFRLLVFLFLVVRVLEPENEYTGLALGINNRGELLVRREDGHVEEIYAGEVSVRGVYGYV